MERRGRLPTEPGPGGHTSPLISSPIKSPPPPREHLHEDPPFKGNLRLLSQNIFLFKVLYGTEEKFFDTEKIWIPYADSCLVLINKGN